MPERSLKPISKTLQLSISVASDSGIVPTRLFPERSKLITLPLLSQLTPYQVLIGLDVHQFVLLVHLSPFVELYKSIKACFTGEIARSSPLSEAIGRIWLRTIFTHLFVLLVI